VATLFAPRLAEHFGWPTTFGIAMLPIALVLVVLLAGVGVCVALVGTMPTVSVAVGPLFLAMALLGMGNGAVFQLVPQRFPERMGLETDVVGAAGGLGGFMLPSVLGAIRDDTGSYAPGLFGCAAVFLCGLLAGLDDESPA
jgi:NNP family nitrate/nitrite transporter-like MFS transporter